MEGWHEVGASSETDFMFKGRHLDRSVILLCVRWYLAHTLMLLGRCPMPCNRPFCT
jgi:hypothetical protein